MPKTFRDRSEAGRLLAARLDAFANRDDVLILALPRGGVPVGFELARALRAPMDVFVVRKLGVPGHEELAMGAVASGGVRVINEDVVNALNISDEDIEQVARSEREELERRERLYRDDRPAPDVRGRTVIVVDDGLATGSTMRAAVKALRRLGPARIVVAVPTAAPSTLAEFQRLADECVSVITPEPFRAVGLWYDDFSQTTDDEVRDLLNQVADAPRERTVAIPADGRQVKGTLSVPRSPIGVVAFAHGSGSGRFSPRNQFVAEALREAGFATLLIDLLEEDEAEDRAKVFDIPLLAARLRAAGTWLGEDAETRALPLGYFGASTGAAAALVAAASDPGRVGAVVSRGGRPDLARDALPIVKAPTLLIVGSRDEQVLELNRRALAALRCPKQLAVVPGASHLFAEPGTLEEVARLAADWFTQTLGEQAS